MATVEPLQPNQVSTGSPAESGPGTPSPSTPANVTNTPMSQPDVSIPVTLVSQSIDTTALQRTLKTLSDGIVHMQQEVAAVRAENADLRKEVLESTRRTEISQEQYAALFETVNSYAEQLKAVQADFMGRYEIRQNLQRIDEEAVKIRAFTVELDSRKIDTHSSVLENRVRETSEDSCTRFNLRFERDIKEWSMKQIGHVDTKLMKMIQDQVATARGALEEEDKRLDVRSSEISELLKETRKDQDAGFGSTRQMTKLLLQKLETHEKTLDASEHLSLAATDRVYTNFRLFLSAVGVEWNELSPLYPDRGIIARDEEDIEELFQRDVTKAYRAGENNKGWRAIKGADPKMLPHMGNLGDDDGSADIRRLEVLREERIREMDRNKKLKQAKRQQQQVSQSAAQTTSDSTRLLLGTSLFSSFRNSLHTHTLQHLSALKDDLASDFSEQLQVFHRDLSHKIGTTRAIELIEDYATRTTKQLLQEVRAELDKLSREAVKHGEISSALATKVDQNKMIEKADVIAVDELEAALRETISGSIDSLRVRIHAEVSGKLKDAMAKKWDKEDVRVLGLVQAFESGQIAMGAAARIDKSSHEQGDTCLSCNRPMTAPIPGNAAVTAGSASPLVVAHPAPSGNWTVRHASSPRQNEVSTPMSSQIALQAPSPHQQAAADPAPSDATPQPLDVADVAAAAVHQASIAMASNSIPSASRSPTSTPKQQSVGIANIQRQVNEKYRPPVGASPPSIVINKSPRHAAAEATKAQRVGELQAAQEVLHLEQMNSRARQGNAQTDLDKFELRGWADTVERSHGAKAAAAIEASEKRTTSDGRNSRPGSARTPRPPSAKK